MQPMFDTALRRLVPTGGNTRKFGIELEMLDEDDIGGERQVDCDCDSPCCRGYYMEEGTGYVDEAIYRMTRAGLLPGNARMHAYHCRCERCDYRRIDPFLTAQEDSTVGVEFITRIATVEADWGQVRTLIDATDRIWENTRTPDGWASWGNHIHVACRDPGSVATIASRILAMDSLDWDKIGCGDCESGRVRGYNDKPSKALGYNGNWAQERANTVEFRLWNTPADAALIGFHIATSIALARFSSALTRSGATLTTDDFDANTVEVVECLAAAMPKVAETPNYVDRLMENVA